MVLINWTATCKRIKLEYFLTQYTKINSKWTKDLNISPVTIKLLYGKTGKTLINCSRSFWTNFLYLKKKVLIGPS